jgi:hypothetical protein
MPSLLATYADTSIPTSTHEIKRELPELASPGEEPTAYLGALQKAAREMQDEVNRMLTGRMEGEKAGKEEEGYGEEEGLEAEV